MSHTTIKCPFPQCDTKIIPYTEALVQSVIEVPNAPEMVNVDQPVTKFFRVEDMWDFDNIGVSRPLQDIKDFKINDEIFDIERILICSECDKGPIGFAGHFSNQEKHPNSLLYFLSCDSMKYQ